MKLSDIVFSCHCGSNPLWNEHPHAKPNDEERALFSVFLQNVVPGLVKAGKSNLHAVKVWNEGWKKVDECLDYLQSGKPNAERVILGL